MTEGLPAYLTGMLKLVCGVTEVGLITTVDDGLHLLEKWEPKIATPSMWPPGPVTETLRLLATAASTDGLATVLQSLHQMQRWAAAYWADSDYSAVWLHAQLAAETGERRTLVRKLEATFGTGWFDAEAVAYQLELTLTIEREPYWEATTPIGPDIATAISLLGGAVALSAVGGDAPARLTRLTVMPVTLAAGTYSKLWLGFRSTERHDPVAQFVSLWEIENATPGTDTAAMSSAFQSGGAGLKCTFATATGWAKRASWYLEDMAPWPTSLPEASRGTFLVLLRANSDTVTAIDVQLRAGHVDYLTYASEIARVQLATNGLFALGLLTLPLRDMHALGAEKTTVELHQRFELWARQVSGSAALDMDCLLLIPADELLIAVDNTVLRDVSGRFNMTLLSSAPEGQIAGLAEDYDSAAVMWYAISAPDVAASGLGIGLGVGRLYIAGTLADNTNKVADTVDVAVTHVSRFLSLRGATL